MAEHYSSKILEKQLYEVWKTQNFNHALTTNDGQEITILDLGVFDDSLAGPDFKNARVRVGNITYVGDIEIDNSYADWKNHGHNIDAKYSKVILHVTFENKFNQHYAYTKEGRKIPTLSLNKFLNESTISELKGTAKQPDTHETELLRCSHYCDKISVEERRNFISGLGIERFKRKCDRIYRRLKELKYIHDLNIKEPVIQYDLAPEFLEKHFSAEDFKDKYLWQQVLYEMVFEALGYAKNKTIMMNLAQSADISFLTKLSSNADFVPITEAALFNIAGLVPEVKKMNDGEFSEYSKNLSKSWENISKIYDGKTFYETDWHFFKLRPQNFPTIRLAGGVRLLKSILFGNLIGTIIKKTDEINNLNVLVNSLRSLFILRAEGYWSNHYVFDKPSNGEIKYFVGASRADEILINVVIPFLSVYFDVFANPAMSKKVLKIYNIFQQNDDNNIVLKVAESLQMKEYLTKTIYVQGMIEVFRNYCSKNKCLECRIGKLVFS
ncbi:MAG: DUF2851 family protein [bacterium]